MDAGGSVGRFMLTPRCPLQGKDVQVTVGQPQTPKLDTAVPQTARIWNYLLGGKDNFAVDRIVGDEISAALPQLAQDARVVYVDNDPLVLAQARRLLTGTPEGATDYLDADLRDPGRILDEASRTLDFGRPVALMLMGILGHVESDDEAKLIIKSFMDRLPSGSYLAMYDGSDTSEAVTEAVRIYNKSANPKYHLRSPERMTGLFDGMDIVEPGVVSVTRWKPDTGSESLPHEIDQFCAVGRKP
jgi:hypothetical protein